MQPIIKHPTWRHRRTTLERVLTFINIVCGVTVVLTESIQNGGGSLLVRRLNFPGRSQNLPMQPNAHIDVTNKDVCSTSECLKTASKALEMMDRNVNPCDDFYKYACGTFVQKTIIPDNKNEVTMYSMNGDSIEQQLSSLLREGVYDKEEAIPFKLVQKLYNVCMNKTRIEEKGPQPLLDMMETLGGWPILNGDKWDLNSSWSWVKSVKDFRHNGYSTDYFLNFTIVRHPRNSTRQIIHIDQAPLGIEREYLVKGLENAIVSAYYNYMVDMAVLLGADKKRAKRELLDSLNFEIALANISLPNEKRRNATALYNPMTVKEFQQRYPYTDWLEYFNAILKDTGISIKKNEPIIVIAPAYMEQLGALLQKTPKRVMANYVMWRISEYSSTFLNEKLRKRRFQFKGKQENKSRGTTCVEITFDTLPMLVNAQYIRKNFREGTKRDVLVMVDNIRNVLIDTLKKVDWMDEISRKSALEKASSMVARIGYPDKLLDDGMIAKYYKDLVLRSGNSYLNNILSINKFSQTKHFELLRIPFVKSDWFIVQRPTIVNGFHNRYTNSIEVLYGILQGQYYSYDRQKYLNYGGIGMVIGHEFSHGFDDLGRRFDKNGNLVDWLQPEAKKAFQEKARCIIEQYGNYTEPTVKWNLNGSSTLNDNIADIGGIELAYHAYREWTKKHGPEQRLPGLNLRPEQMFWLSAAQAWCSVYRPETMKMRITTGVHSPGQFRVLGPMSNMHEFAKDFNCPAGSPMNPVRKCKWW